MSNTTKIQEIPNISTVDAKKTTTVGVERIFKYCSIFCVTMIILCLPGFLRFRQYCQSKGIYVFSNDSIYMVLIGFMIIFITRYAYYWFARKYIDQFVKPKYQGQERQRKIDTFLKLSYDWAFYLSVSIYFYTEFRNQYWFPKVVGGEGTCSDIYKEYPNWPVLKRSSIQDYFCFQLGVHVFSLFQLFIIRREKQRKYFQWTLHHSLASALILFSMWCNQTVMGAMILAIHDVSDIFLTVTRLYFQAKLPKFLKNIVVQIIIIIQIFTAWIYFRLVIFPCCLLYNVYVKIPEPTDIWYMIKYQYIYLLFMASILVVMHVYWLCYMIKAMLAYLSKQDVVNIYDAQKTQ